MHPYLIDLGFVHLPLLGEVRLALPTYGFLVATGVLIAWVVFLKKSGARGWTWNAPVAWPCGLPLPVWWEPRRAWWRWNSASS